MSTRDAATCWGERNRLLPSADEHHVSTCVETFVGYVLVPLVLPSTRRSAAFLLANRSAARSAVAL